MYLHIIKKSSILQYVINAHFHCRLFHLTFNNHIRRVNSKYSVSDSESDLDKENIDPSQIVQKSYSNFLGIESDEGVIVIDPNEISKNDLHHSMQLTGVKKFYKEKYYRTSFGVIRQDSDNKLNFHGQFGNQADSMFPHKSTDDSEVSNEFHKLKSNVLNILYKDSIHNSRPKSDFNKSISSSKPLTDNLCTVSSIVENENKMYNLKKDLNETQDMSYIDESFFGNLVEKDISNENTVNNTNPVDELNYLDKAFFGHEILIKNHVPHSKSKSFENTVSNDKTESKEEFSNKNVSPVEEFNNLDKTDFSKDYISHSETNSFKNDLSNDELHLDENKSQNVSLDDKSEDKFAVNYVKNFRVKEKLNFLQDSNIYASSKTTSNSDNIHISKVPFQNKFMINNLDNGDHLQLENFQKSKAANFVKNSQTNKNLSEHDTAIELNDKQISESSSEIYSISNVQSLNAKSNVASDNDINSFAEKTSSQRNITEKSTENEQITTAEAFVEKLRKESEMKKSVEKGASASSGEKLDSKGFRILKNQVLDLSYCTRNEIITILKDNIIYSDDDLLVLNKPYSLVIHDSQTTKSPCLSELLDDFAKDIDRKRTDPKLYTVHRLDKETTGCLLLAKNEDTAETIKSLFVQRKIIKKYLILTSRIPDPLQGVIDIPVAEGSVDGRKRMVLQPQLPKDMGYQNHSKGGKRAVTCYKVLSVSGNAALVEATTETGIKHQIRVHFGFGLSCPILGDHKYSHLDKLAPQKLPSDLLQKLHVRQSKVRHIPMHLHAQSLTIPGYLDGRNLYVTAPLPDHMRENLKRLKFKKKNKLIL